jgi:hypothetical protein
MFSRKRDDILASVERPRPKMALQLAIVLAVLLGAGILGDLTEWKEPAAPTPSAFAPTAALAQQQSQQRVRSKKDIRGFYAGMEVVEFEQQLKSIGCKIDREKLQTSSEAGCTISDGSFTFRFTKNLNPSVLYETAFQYVAGTKPPEMIALVSSQYGILPKKVDQDWGVDSKKTEVMDSTIHGFMAAFTGIRISIAEWDLSDQMLLELKGIGNYELRLYSKKLADQDAEVLRTKRDSERKNSNRTPKF